jgi:hypothetical protein
MRMTSAQFRLLVATYLVAVVLAIAGHILTAAELPVPLREFVRVADGTTWMATWVGALYLVLATASTIGVLLFKAWARSLFTVLLVFGAMPWDGPVVYPPLEYLFVNLEFILGGAVVGAAHWSAVKDLFNAKPKQ